MSAPEIFTERLALTSLRPDDAAAMFAYRADPSVGRYQSWVPGTVDEVTRFIDDMQTLAFDTPDTWFQLAIRRREGDPLLGDLGIHFLKDEPRQVEIGVTIAPSHQRRGYGTEAVRGLLGYLLGTLRKHRVVASVDPRNESSIAMLGRIGMRQEAHFRSSLWIRGEWVDDLVFAMLESDDVPL